MGILEDRTNKILSAQTEQISFKPKEIKSSISNPNDFLSSDSFSFVYKNGKLHVNDGSLSHVQLAIAHKIENFDQYRDPAGRGLHNKSTLSVWFSYDDAFEIPYCNSIFALRGGGLISDDTEIKFYDTRSPNEYTTLKAFVKDYYNNVEDIWIPGGKVRLGRFDRG